jgi:hypothetical protein
MCPDAADAETHAFRNVALSPITASPMKMLPKWPMLKTGGPVRPVADFDAGQHLDRFLPQDCT